MKTNLIRVLSLLLMVMFIHIHSFAVSSSNSLLTDPSDFDEDEIYNAFSEIDELIRYVSDNDLASYSDVQAYDSSLLSLVDNDPDIALSNHDKFSFNKQTAYLAGCIFGAVGIVLVAIVNNGDQERLKSAIWGCVTSGCVSLSSVIAVYIIFFSYFALYW